MEDFAYFIKCSSIYATLKEEYQSHVFVARKTNDRRRYMKRENLDFLEAEQVDKVMAL